MDMKDDTTGRTGTDGHVLSDSEVEAVMNDLLAGKSTDAVARPYGRTTGWSSHLARMNGLIWTHGPENKPCHWRRGVRPSDAPRSVHPSAVADIVAYLVQGKTAEELATMYATSRTLIRDVAHRAGYECYPPNQFGRWMRAEDVPAQESFVDMTVLSEPRSRVAAFSRWLDPEDAEAIDQEILKTYTEWQKAQSDLQLAREDTDRIAAELASAPLARMRAEEHLAKHVELLQASDAESRRLQYTIQEYIELLQISDVENKRLQNTITDWEPKVAEWETNKNQQKRHKILQSFDLLRGRNGGRDESTESVA